MNTEITTLHLCK